MAKKIKAPHVPGKKEALEIQAKPENEATKRAAAFFDKLSFDKYPFEIDTKQMKIVMDATIAYIRDELLKGYDTDNISVIDTQCLLIKARAYYIRRFDELAAIM